MKDTYWYQRMTSFVDPFQDPLEEGYQAAQSLLALGSGGLFGVGLGKACIKTCICRNRRTTLSWRS